MHHLLTILILLPLAGALLVASGPVRLRSPMTRLVVALSSASSFALWFWFRPTTPDLQLEAHFSVWPAVGLTYHVGLDGIGYFFVLTTGVACLAAVRWLPSFAPASSGRGHAWFLVAYASLLAACLAANASLFALAWALALVSMSLVSADNATRASTGLYVRRGLGAIVVLVLVGVTTRVAGGATSAGLLGAAGAGASSSMGVVLVAAWLVALLLPLWMVTTGPRVTSGGRVQIGEGVVLAALAAGVAMCGLLRFGLALSPMASAWTGQLPRLALCVACGGAVLMALESQAERRMLWPSVVTGAAAAGACLLLTPDGLSHGVRMVAVQCMVVAAAVAAASAWTRDVSRGDASGVASGPMRAVGALAALLAGIAVYQGGAMTAWSAAWNSGAVAAMLVSQAAVACAHGLPRWRETDAVSGAWRAQVPALMSAALLAVAAVTLGLSPMRASRLLRVPTLKLAASMDARYQGEFVAACDTAVTPEMKAASPAAQFLAAAPCGPDGKPLGEGGVAAPAGIGSVVDEVGTGRTRGGPGQPAR